MVRLMTLRVGIYCRISRDQEGRELGVDRQEQDCREYVERRGWTLVGVYMDNDISASAKSTKPRPDYDRLLSDARSGHINVIVAYTSGRLTRRPLEHEAQITIARDLRVRFEYLRSPSFDLNTAAGREVARIMAAKDTGEAEEIAERTERDVRRRAEAGEFHGGPVPFGYEGTRTIASGRAKITAFEPHPAHAEWVKEAVRRLLNGEGLHGVVVDWNSKGRTTVRGSRWSRKALRNIVASPSIVGARLYGGQEYPVPWKAIVDREDWDRLQVILNDPSRNHGKGNARKYELSGLVWCARPLDNGHMGPVNQGGTPICNHRMLSTSETRLAGPAYACVPQTGGCGRMRIAMGPLEQFIEGQVFATIDLRDATPSELPADDPTTDLRRAIAQDDQALIELDNERDDGLIPDRATYTRRRNRISDRLQANREALNRAVMTHTRATLPPADELRAEWADRDVVWKRTILGAVIERVYINPHPAGVTVAPPRRRGETDEAHRDRVDRHTARVLEQRVDVRWNG